MYDQTLHAAIAATYLVDVDCFFEPHASCAAAACTFTAGKIHQVKLAAPELNLRGSCKFCCFCVAFQSAV